jgi:hypothetical protein
MAEIVETLESTGVVGFPVRALVEMLAETASFQQRCGANSPAEAMKSIYRPHGVFTREVQPTGPMAVVWPKGLSMDQASGPGLRLKQANLCILLHDIDEKYAAQPEWSEADFTNWAGAVLSDLADLSGVDDRLVIQEIEMLEGTLLPPSLIAQGEGKPFWSVELELTVAAVRR